MRYAMCLMVLLAWGCSAGEKNYKELERDTGDPFQTERDPLFRGAADDADGVTADEADKIQVVRADEPSVHGLSRTHWPTIEFTAAEGMSGYGWTVDRRYVDEMPEQRFDAALRGAAPGNWSLGNVIGGGIQRDGAPGGGGAAPRSPAGP